MSNLTDFSAATVPSTDSSANSLERDVVGSKADTPAATGTAANSTLSLLAYLKSIWNILRGRTTIVSVARSSLTNSPGTLDLRPAAGKTRKIFLTVTAGGSNGLEIDWYDGTNVFPLLIVNAGLTGYISVDASDSVAGLRIFNNSSNTCFYSYSAVDTTTP